MVIIRVRHDLRKWKVFYPGRFAALYSFSGFGASAEKCMRDWLPEDEVPFHTLYREYAQQHEKTMQMMSHILHGRMVSAKITRKLMIRCVCATAAITM